METLLKHIKSYIIPTLVFSIAIGAFSLSADLFASTGADAGLAADLLSIEDKPDAVGSTPIRQAVITLINYLLGFLGLIAVAFVVYAGVLMVIDAGAEENVQKAKKIITWAGVGIIVILLSFAIVNFFTDFGNRLPGGS